MAQSIKLDIFEEFHFILIGFVTTEPIYRLSWLFNQELGFNLVSFPSIELLHKKSKIIQSFTRFGEEDEDGSLIELIQNKSEHGLFIEEHKNIDYFLKVDGRDLNAAGLINSLKTIKNISLIVEVQPGSLKSKDRLLFRIGED